MPGPERRLPWAGLLATLVVLVLEAWAFRPSLRWNAIQHRINEERHLELGLAKDRLQLAKLDRLHANIATSVVLGSSRANRGIQLHEVPKSVSGRIAKLAHAGLNPLELRSLLPDLRARHPEVAVLMLSSFDTHAPLRFTPHAMGPDLGAVGAVLRHTGADFALAHRTDLLRMALAAVSDTYRFRRVLGAAGLERLTTFRFDERWRVREPARPPPVLGTSIDGDSPEARHELDRLAREGHFEVDAWDSVRHQLAQILALSAGPHAELQMDLVRDLVTSLRAGGARVVVLEGPLHPAVQDLRRPEVEAGFEAFMQELTSDPGVRFIPLEDQPAYLPEHFGDLTHLAGEGSRRMTTFVVREMEAEFLAMLAAGEFGAGTGDR